MQVETKVMTNNSLVQLLAVFACMATIAFCYSLHQLCKRGICCSDVLCSSIALISVGAVLLCVKIAEPRPLVSYVIAVVVVSSVVALCLSSSKRHGDKLGGSSDSNMKKK